MSKPITRRRQLKAKVSIWFDRKVRRRWHDSRLYRWHADRMRDKYG